MKNIFSYLLLFIGSLVAFNASAAQCTLSGNSFSLVLHDNRPTHLINSQEVARCYPEFYKTHFSDLPVERLIPFLVTNKDKKTMLDVYIPYTVLLKNQKINTFFQKISDQLVTHSVQYDGTITLSKEMLLRIAQKIEAEQLLRSKETDKAMQAMILQKQEWETKCKQYEQSMEERPQLLRNQQIQFDEKQAILEEGFEKQKNQYESPNDATILDLQQKLRNQ